MIEPGRYVAAPAGVLHAQVVLVSHKSYGDEARWVYLDVGRFGGLAETEDEAIQYRLVTDRDGGPAGPVILAGPTCDSVDILYQRTPYDLPVDLRAGDVVRILGAGAYTATYASVGFNGIPPLRTVCRPSGPGAGA
jgi:ornithine decarboxylase